MNEQPSGMEYGGLFWWNIGDNGNFSSAFIPGRESHGAVAVMSLLATSGQRARETSHVVEIPQVGLPP